MDEILRNAPEDALRVYPQNLTKEEFLSSVILVRQAIFRNSAILSAFQETGLIPYSPDIVFDKLREERPVTPVSSSPSTSFEKPWATPKTSQQFMEYQERLANLEPGSDYYNEGISKLLKGSLAQSHLLEGLKTEFERRSKVALQNNECEDLAHGANSKGIQSTPTA